MLIVIDTDDLQRLGIGYTEAAVLEYLKSKKDKNGIVWKSLQEIGDDVGLNRNQVFNALKNLKNKNLVIKGSTIPPSIKVKENAGS